MFLANDKGEGDAALQYLKRTRVQPYLNRNIRKSVLSMGNALSSIAGRMSTSTEEPSYSSAQEDDQPPAKRQKTGSFQETSNDHQAFHRLASESPRRKTLGQVTNARKTQPKVPVQPIQPGSFYVTPSVRPANVKPEPPERSKASISDLLPVSPSHFEKALRVELTHIQCREDDSHVFWGAPKVKVDIECLCSVALISKVSEPRPVDTEKSRKNQRCILRVSLVDGTIKRQFLSLEPFIFTAQEDLYVNRVIPSKAGGTLDTFGFADEYYVQVTIERKGPQKHWPPFEIPIFVGKVGVVSFYEQIRRGTFLEKDLLLFCQKKSVFQLEGQTGVFPLKMANAGQRETTLYDLGINITWSQPSSLNGGKASTLEACNIIAEDLKDVESRPPSTEIADTAESPSRARREKSNVATYNLKALSAIQQGRQPKPHKVSKSRTGEETAEIMKITYIFEEVSNYGLKRETTILGFKCPICSTKQATLQGLRLHLRTIHYHFKCRLRSTNPPCFLVKLARSNHSNSTREFYMGKPKALFDLERFLGGDDTWAQSRHLSPLNGPLSESQLEISDKSPDSSQYASRYSSPTTSNATDRFPDAGKKSVDFLTKPRPRLQVHGARGRSQKPLYNVVTKRVLEPGEDRPSSDDEGDEGWHHQKHRDIIFDFSDLTSEERDLIVYWNVFAMKARLSSERSMFQILKIFAETNKAWLSELESRQMELYKHIQAFVMRGVVTDEECHTIIDILRKARTNLKDAGSKEAELVSNFRSSQDCICGELIIDGTIVTCAGPDCSTPRFHRKCAEGFLKSGAKVGRWLCKECA